MMTKLYPLNFICAVIFGSAAVLFVSFSISDGLVPRTPVEISIYVIVAAIAVFSTLSSIRRTRPSRFVRVTGLTLASLSGVLMVLIVDLMRDTLGMVTDGTLPADEEWSGTWPFLPPLAFLFIFSILAAKSARLK